MLHLVHYKHMEQIQKEVAKCAENVQKCAEPQKKENPTRNLTILRGILVRSRELESLAL